MKHTTPETQTAIDAIDPLALSRQRPELSASCPLTVAQKVILIGSSLLLMWMAVTCPTVTALSFIVFSTLFYVVFTVYKFVLMRYSIASHSEITVTEAEMRALDRNSLPVYSVLVPMYKEPESIKPMTAALTALDYPADKKDVQLLLEADDAATLAAVDQCPLPKGFRVTVVPVSHPRTKPKACNIGLELALGEYLVIFDAEDRPDPDQLLKAVIGFNRVTPEVICLQSKLNFYNPRQNILTKWFTAEYSAWFDLSLPGLSALGAVIPLGGTSNHFKTGILRDLLGWDAFNVTEDCDLGVRIYRAGFRSRMLNTTTWEEACGRFPFWIRQRTRWLKGYIQTYFVHMRRPFALLRELGWRNMLHFQILIGGVVFSFLINPLFWLLALTWFVTRIDALTTLFPGPVFAMGAFCLFVGNFAFAYTGGVACFRRGYYDLVKVALMSPLYWVMMSISGWRAFAQFFSDPFYWEKTNHGFWEDEQN